MKTNSKRSYEHYMPRTTNFLYKYTYTSVPSSHVHRMIIFVRWLINAGETIENDREKRRNRCVALGNQYGVLMILAKGFSLLFGLTHALLKFASFYITNFSLVRWMNTCAIECYDLPMVLLTVTRYTTFEGSIAVIESSSVRVITYL